MTVKRALFVAAAAAAISALLLWLPMEAGLAALAAMGTLIFGTYALREREALRHVIRLVRRILEKDVSAPTSTSNGRKAEEPDAHASVSARLDQLEASLARLGELGAEVSGLHAAATSEVVSRQEAHRGDLLGRVDQLEAKLGETLAKLDAGIVAADKRLGYAATQTELRRLHAEAKVARKQEFRQTEALLSLHSLFSVRGPLPPSRGWAASPDVLLLLATLVLERRPRLVVELGSGLSTVWLSYALEKIGGDRRFISIEHEAKFAAKARGLLASHGLQSVADVRLAPLVGIDLDGESWLWYDPTAFADLDDCDLLFVDGPPASTGRRARYPALPLFEKRLAEHAAVVLDDCVREEEKEIVAEWRAAGDWQIEMLDHEKGTALLTR